MKKKIIENLIIISCCLIGFMYVFNFIINASIDVPVSDYLRIINYYLEDVFDLHYLFSIECLSRTPITFLFRIINVSFFNYSTFFDKIVSLISLSVFNFVILKYIFKKIDNIVLKLLSSIMVTSTSFSLISWEMLLNGTAYPHYMAEALFVITYYLFDKHYDDWFICFSQNISKNNVKTNMLAFLILMVASALCFGGSYMVAFLFTISSFCFIFYLINFSLSSENILLKKLSNQEQKNNIITMLCCLISVVLFNISNNSGEPYTHIGMKDISLFELLKTDITFPIRFLMKSLVSSIIGVDNINFAIQIGSINEIIIYGIAVLIMIMIIFVFIVVIKRKYYQKNMFLMLLAYNGIVNYLLIFFARYKFVKDTYGMSSRYGIQYMFLTISIIILLFKILDDNKKIFSPIVSFISVAMILCLVSAGLTTNYHEQLLVNARKLNYEKAKEVALNIDDYPEEELGNIFEYQRGADQIKKAMDIIKSNKLNIFKE